MLFNVRMIGRAIDREIERNFHSAFAHLFFEPLEIYQRSQCRLDRLVSASLTSDGPWHARIARLARDGVVPTLAVGVTNGMNRRKINDVETHCFCIVNSRQTIAESRSAIATAFCRARKKFIPRAD